MEILIILCIPQLLIHLSTYKLQRRERERFIKCLFIKIYKAWARLRNKSFTASYPTPAQLDYFQSRVLSLNRRLRDSVGNKPSINHPTNPLSARILTVFHYAYAYYTEQIILSINLLIRQINGRNNSCDTPFSRSIMRGGLRRPSLTYFLYGITVETIRDIY